MAVTFGPKPKIAAIFGPTDRNVIAIFAGPNMAAIFGPGPNVVATFGLGPNVATVQLISNIACIF